MSKEKLPSNLDELLQIFEIILNRNRCPLSETDRVLLARSCEILRDLKKQNVVKMSEKSSLELAEEFTVLLLRFFQVFEIVKHLL